VFFSCAQKEGLDFGQKGAINSLKEKTFILGYAGSESFVGESLSLVRQGGGIWKSLRKEGLLFYFP